MFALFEAGFDSADPVAVSALFLLTFYIHIAFIVAPSVLLVARKHDTSCAVCHILVGSLVRNSRYFMPIFSAKNADARHIKDAVAYFAS